VIKGSISGMLSLWMDISVIFSKSLESGG